jgi:hypothetical protein
MKYSILVFLGNVQFIKQQLFLDPAVVEYVQSFTIEYNMFQSLSRATLLVSVVIPDPEARSTGRLHNVALYHSTRFDIWRMTGHRLV